MPRYHVQKVGILLGSDLLRYAVSPPAALDYGKHRTANRKERNRHCAWHDHADSSMRQLLLRFHRFFRFFRLPRLKHTRPLPCIVVSTRCRHHTVIARKFPDEHIPAMLIGNDVHRLAMRVELTS